MQNNHDLSMVTEKCMGHFNNDMFPFTHLENCTSFKNKTIKYWEVKVIGRTTCLPFYMKKDLKKTR